MVTLCNPMSCSGFGKKGMAFLGGCSMVWIAAVILFFIIVLSRRWIAEAINMPWSGIGAFGLGYLSLLITVILTCSHKFGLVAGIIGCYVGAYFGGMVFGDSGGGY